MMKRIFSVLAAFLLIVHLSGCTGMQNKDIPEIRSHVDTFLTATLENEPNTAYGVFLKSLPRAKFNSVFPQIRELLKDVEEYTLQPIHFSQSSQDGKTIRHITYRMETNSGVFVVTATAADNKDGLLNIFIVPEEQTTLVHTGTPGSMKGASVIQWIVLILGFLTWGLVLWAFVDCCRRSVRTKPLWLLLIALGASLFTVSFIGGIISFRFHVGIYLTVTSLVKYGDGSSLLQLRIPVGAIVYLCLRKRLEKPLVDPPASTELPGEETKLTEQE